MTGGFIFIDTAGKAWKKMPRYPFIDRKSINPRAVVSKQTQPPEGIVRVLVFIERLGVGGARVDRNHSGRALRALDQGVRS